MNVVVRAPNRSVSFQSPPENRILYSALVAGIDLPYECISGTCGSCKARLRSGIVEKLWVNAPGCSLIKTGEYLLCQSAAGGDCEFEIGSSIADQIDVEAPTYRRGVLRNWRILSADIIAFNVEFEKEISFKAGQFVALQFPGVEGARCYSIVNSKSPTRFLDFVIKRKPGGAVSEWIFSVDRSGLVIDCFGATGKAIYDPALPHDILCVAGGSGIAGMMSIVARAAQNEHFLRHKGHVFFGLRSGKDSFFLEELSELARTSPGSLQVTVALSEEVPHETLRNTYPAISFEHGMVHEVLSKKASLPLANVSAFVAGPPPAVSATLRVMLLQLKLAAASIKYDKFA